jgi:predicted cupin superfamily sugar epimerase
MFEDILHSYDWYAHPEGHRFVQVHRDVHRTCGHWLYQPREIGALHRVLNSEELWCIHRGSLEVHVLSPDGMHTSLRLGTDLAAGERPVLAVPQGHWQGAEMPDGVPFALGSNVCAPGFSWDEFELGNRDELIHQFPTHCDLIVRLTKDGAQPSRETYERNR